MEILSIQYLRGCAALMIVFYHLKLQLDRVGYAGYWPHFLSTGVDIFFVISGFIMWVTTTSGMTTLEFFRRRIVRIVPLYWVLTSVVLATTIAVPSAVQSGRFDGFHVLGSYLFIPVAHPVLGAMQPLLVPGWTLNYEMFFYAIFGLALILPAIPRLLSVSAILIGLAAIQLLIAVPPLTPLGFYTSDRVIEFAFGIVLGWLYVRGIRVAKPLAWAAFLLGAGAIALIGDSDMSRGLAIGVPALLVVAGAVTIERHTGIPKIGGLYLLGNASYSLYLSHTIVLSMIWQLWRRFSPGSFPGDLLVFGGFSIAAATTIGVLIYLYIEVPMLRLGRLQIFGAKAP